MKTNNSGSSNISQLFVVVACIVFAAVAGYFIGYLWSILLAVAFFSWQNKKRMKANQSGYCLAIVQKRLARVAPAFLMIAIGVCVGVYTYFQLQEGFSDLEFMEKFKIIVAAVITLGFTIGGIAWGYTGIRDALFPDKSSLAKSIQSQLPNQGSLLDSNQLFSIVDRDISENGKWFDKIAVGNEWLLGNDDASYIPRIRLIFGRDEIIRRHTNGSVQTTRITELITIDDLKHSHSNTLSNYKELSPLMDYLLLKNPDAFVKPYKEYLDALSMSDTDWQMLLIDYNRRKSDRKLASYTTENKPAQNMILTLSDGNVTSRLSSDLIEKTLKECIATGDEYFTLTPGVPINAFGRQFASLECQVYTYEAGEYNDDYDSESAASSEGDVTEFEFLLKTVVSDEKPKTEAMSFITTDHKEALKILKNWFEGRVLNLNDWASIWLPLPSKKNVEQHESPRPSLGLTAASGAFQHHNTFTIEDVEIAAEGLTDGTYQAVDLTLSGGYMWMRIEIGDKTDGRCKVFCTYPDNGTLHFYKNRCSHKQAATWLVDFGKAKFKPDGSDWKDYTKQALKQSKSNTKK